MTLPYSKNPSFARIPHPALRSTFISALRAAFGGSAPKRACGRSPREKGMVAAQ